MKTTRRARSAAKQLFRLCLANRLVDEERTRQVIRHLAESTRRDRVAVLWQFRRLLKLYLAAHTATVECATPLPPDLRADVQTRLSRIYGTGLSVAFSDRPELIGGMRITIGSDVYDGSIQGELAALESRF